MTTHTQAEIFIKTLAEMRDEDRERQKARLRVQLKVHVDRFVQEFRTGFNDSQHSSDWVPQSKLAAQRAVSQSWDE